MPSTIIQTALPVVRPALGCPRCYSRHVYHSQAKNRLEALASRVGIHMLRCRQCFHRFLLI